MSILSQEPVQSVNIGSTYNIQLVRSDWSYPWNTLLTKLNELEATDHNAINKLIYSTYFDFNPHIAVKEKEAKGNIVYACDIFQISSSAVGVPYKLGELVISKKKS